MLKRVVSISDLLAVALVMAPMSCKPRPEGVSEHQRSTLCDQVQAALLSDYVTRIDDRRITSGARLDAIRQVLGASSNPPTVVASALRSDGGVEPVLGQCGASGYSMSPSEEHVDAGKRFLIRVGLVERASGASWRFAISVTENPSHPRPGHLMAAALIGTLSRGVDGGWVIADAEEVSAPPELNDL